MKGVGARTTNEDKSSHLESIIRVLEEMLLDP